MNNPSDVSFLLVLAEGLASFFSPCVIPLLPLYIGYLSGNARIVKEDGSVEYNRKKVFFQTVCFVLGISFSFLILGLTFTAIGQALQKYKVYFQLVAGVLIIVLGLFQLGVFQSKFLSKERRLNVNTDKPMGPWMAFVLGFLFSFTWTPCVGPALTSILLLVSTTSGGYWYVLVYAIGFVGPFLLLGLFTSEVLNFLKRKRNLLPVVVKIGAVILLIMGAYSIYQGIDALKNPPVEEEESVLPQFTLPDINGKQHSLSDYKGKVIFLNFFTTWCGYCQQEIIHLDEVNLENDPEVQIVGILVGSGETDQQIRDYLESKNLSYPVLLDTDGTVAAAYYVQAYPWSWVISKSYRPLGYVPGAVDLDTLHTVLESAKTEE